MKVLPFKIPKPENNVLIYQVDRAKLFYDRLHQHEEIQISIVIAPMRKLLIIQFKQGHQRLISNFRLKLEGRAMSI